MVAKTRSNLRWHAPPNLRSRFSNLLVSGCSYVWNNSEEHVCTWPYYLEKIAGFEQVFDCSQAGAGSNHIFNSVINEIETNSAVNPQTTLVIVMWSSMYRTDVIAESTMTRDWHFMSNYDFDHERSTLSLFRNVDTKSDPISELCHHYERIVDPVSQVYESYIKIIALDRYLRSQGFEYIFLNWENIDRQFDSSIGLCDRAKGLITDVTSLGEFADLTNQRIPGDGHPTPECHQAWTFQVLIPLLHSRGLIS